MVAVLRLRRRKKRRGRLRCSCRPSGGNTGRLGNGGMNEPISYHYLPVFYLRQWTGGDGRLFRYYRGNGRVISSPISPKRTGSEDRLYTLAWSRSDIFICAASMRPKRFLRCGSPRPPLCNARKPDENIVRPGRDSQDSLTSSVHNLKLTGVSGLQVAW